MLSHVSQGKFISHDINLIGSYSFPLLSYHETKFNVVFTVSMNVVQQTMYERTNKIQPSI